MRFQVSCDRSPSIPLTIQTSPFQVQIAARLPSLKKSKPPKRIQVCQGLAASGGGDDFIDGERAVARAERCRVSREADSNARAPRRVKVLYRAAVLDASRFALLNRDFAGDQLSGADCWDAEKRGCLVAIELSANGRDR